MAGNHKRTHWNHDGWMLIAFVFVVGWVTLDAWQPEAPQFIAPTPRSPQLAKLTQMLENEPVPTYIWLQVPNEPPTLAADEAKPAEETTEAPLLAIPESTELAEWQPVAEVPMELPDLSLVLPPMLFKQADETSKVVDINTPEAIWLREQLSADRMASPAWQAAPIDGLGCLSRLPGAWLDYRSRTQMKAHLADTKRYASPPSLLYGPQLMSPGDRLAMRMTPEVAPTPKWDARSWDEQLLDSTRPWMGAGLNRSLRQGVIAEPSALIKLLSELAGEPYARDWALRSLVAVHESVSSPNRTLVPTSQQLEQLAVLSGEAERLANLAPNAGLATKLRRARYAIWRRVAVWQAVAGVVAPPVEQFSLASTSASNASGRAKTIGTHESVEIDQLLREVEAYENAPSQPRGELLSQRIAQLFDAPSIARNELATTLSDNYNNANLRVAISEEFLNRFLPKGMTKVEPIHDRILGTPVSGHASTETAASVDLLPDPNAWRLGIELTGHANSSTVAFERTVRVRTQGVTSFAARQQVLVNTDGLFTGPVVADATSTSRFVNARSEYDFFPFVHGIVRSKASSAFSQRRSRAQNEVSTKTEARIRQEMDSTVRDAMARAGGEWQARVIDPLSGGGVKIDPVEMLTTDERLIARLRVVHGDNLAAHTPRPRAPSDSVASAQLHESALTSLVAGLELAGQRLTPEQFVERLQKFAPELSEKDVDDDAREAIIEFADGDPVIFELKEGQLHLAWEVRELVVRGTATRNFKVHVYYTPAADGLVARFDHKSGPYFEGNLRNSQRMRLQTIFGKMFPKDSELLLGTKFADDPRLAGLMITQLVIDDGWLGIALGPEQPTRSAQIDRYAPLWR
ncbi:hypothetical protein [Aeoliella mucimassa]|uniref:Uncharacterized protein n=1 Tax=Aeoliella mucimassa TaxID=2527972 RepID=A0A518ATR9_9BACT|nr:hypothetical protein [Aeoliella mucimassa]QDU58124.1 hypothetical protein Pan181_43510 [Aeoliella mucimassa]